MVIWIILLIAFFLRLVSLNQSLWLDEAINVVYAKSNSFWWFVTAYPLGDFHPPGYFAILWLWGNIFGFSEISVRFPSVFLGVATVYITYLIGKNLFDKRTGFLAALFLALAPLHIYYSQEARMYAFAAFAVTLATYFLINTINDKKFSLLGYLLSLTLVFYSDYLAYFILPVHFLFIVFFNSKKVKVFLSSFLIGLLTIIPWFFVLPQQILNGQHTANLIEGWKNVVGGAGIKEASLLIIKTLIGRISFDSNVVYSLIVGFVAIPYILILKKSITKKDNNFKLIFLWLLLPPVAGLLISFFIPVFSYFRFLFILPPFYLLLAIGIEKTAAQYRKIFLALIIAIQIINSSTYLLNNNFHREDWKNAVKFMEKASNQQVVVLLENSEILAPYTYYSQKPSLVLPAFKKVPVQSERDLVDLEKFLLKDQDKTIKVIDSVVIVDYLVDVTDPKKILTSKIQSLGFKESSVTDFRGVGFIRTYRLSK